MYALATRFPNVRRELNPSLHRVLKTKSNLHLIITSLPFCSAYTTNISSPRKGLRQADRKI